MSAYPTNTARPQAADRGNTSKANAKSKARTPVNNLRLDDIRKLIEGRHDFFLRDVEWARRYFFAALPHVIVSENRWLEAVRSWVCMWTPILVQVEGGEWIDEEARKCHAKKRKTPGQDKLCRLLDVQVGEREAFGLCTLTPASESAKDRAEKDRERRRKAEADRRSKNPNHKPRTASKAAKARADGTTASALRSRKWRQDRAAASLDEDVAQQNVTTTERVSCPTDETVNPADAQYSVTTPNAFRAPQYRLDRERVSCPTTIITRHSWSLPFRRAQTSRT